MYNPGDIVLASIQFTDTYEVKVRPALVLFEEHGNFVVCGITSNPRMQGIPLTKREGSAFDSIIKINYVFTISEIMIRKKLFSLNPNKRKAVYEELTQRISSILSG